MAVICLPFKNVQHFVYSRSNFSEPLAEYKMMSPILTKWIAIQQLIIFFQFSLQGHHSRISRIKGTNHKKSAVPKKRNDLQIK